MSNHWRITHRLLQWAKLFHIANAALQNLVPCLGLSLWVRLNCKHSWPRSKDMVRKYHHFLFLFLMTGYMRLAFCIEMHMAHPFEFQHHWKLEITVALTFEWRKKVGIWCLDKPQEYQLTTFRLLYQTGTLRSGEHYFFQISSPCVHGTTSLQIQSKTCTAAAPANKEAQSEH